MTRRSIAIAALLPIAASLSCLSPQDIELDVPPTEVNVPPTFDPIKDVSPSAAEVCVSSMDDAPTEFRVNNLKDANGTRLEARWFVDYEGGFTGYVAQFLTRQEGDPVYPPATFSSKDIDPFHRGSVADPYFVEVVISDGFSASVDAEPKNRAIADGAYAVTYRWAVKYVTGAPCKDR